MAEFEPRPRRPRRQRRPNVLARLTASSLVLVGLLIGIAGGLYYAWVVDPIVYSAGSPARLRPELQEQYLLLVGRSYAYDRDLERARMRLAALDVADVNGHVDAELARFLRDGRAPEEIRPLAELAQALGVTGPSVAVFAPTALAPPTAVPAGSDPTATPTLLPTPTQTRPPTVTPTPTNTPFPSITPTPTPPLIYRVLAQERACDDDGPRPIIEVVVLDALLDPLAGVEVLVTWAEGNDRFFTGFKPDFNPGYGDFEMSPDVSYTVTLAEGSPPVSGMRIEPCANGQPGGWRLTFQNLVVGIPTPDPDDDN